MKVRYTDLYESLDIRLPQFNFFKTFNRCQWYDVPDNVGYELLKSDYFVSEEDVDFLKQFDVLQAEHVALKRWGALGDLLQLTPICRLFKEKFNLTLTLITQKCYIDIMRHFSDVFSFVIPYGSVEKERYKKILYLDGVLEVDHSLTNPERHIHRCQLYADFLQVECKDLDWSVRIPEETNKYTRGLLCL